MQTVKPAGAWRSQKGQLFEQTALRFLCTQGLRLVDKNYRCPFGEIDLIMRHSDLLVFVEVRYRASSKYGHASETVNARKQQKLQRSAQYYLLNHRQHANRPCRFDIVGISTETSHLQFHWLQNAFE